MALLVFGVALAQPPRSYYAWWDRPVAKDLNLTADQTKRIRTTVRFYRGKLIELRAQLEKAELELQDVFEDEHVEASRASAAVEGLSHARENLTRAFAQMSVDLRTVLTQQQWKELQKRRAESDAEEKQRRQQMRQPATPTK